jgi:hypothetical protein
MENDAPKRWWQSLPAILTGLAAVISALTTAFIQLGGNGVVPVQMTGHATDPHTRMEPAAAGPRVPHSVPSEPPALPTRPPEVARAAAAGIDVMTHRVTAADLFGRSRWELDVLRNEVFARHGRRFQRSDLQAYFNAQPWYRGVYAPDAFPNSLVTPVQQANIDLIRAYQGR